MRVAFIDQPLGTLTTHPVRGTSIALLTQELGRRLTPECGVTVYCRKGPSQPLEERVRSIRLRRVRVGMDSRLAPWLRALWRRRPGAKIPLFASPLHHLGYALGVIADLRRTRPDIVHVHNFSQFAPLVRAFLPASKIVLHMHCEWLTQLRAETVRRRLAGVDLVLACSEFVTGKIRAAFPEHAHKCHALYNGVDVDLFTAGEPRERARSDERLLFVGRVSPEKGVHTLIEALSTVGRAFPNVRLDLVGPQTAAPREFILNLSDDPKVRELTKFYDGEGYTARIREQIQCAPPGRIRLLGSLPHEQLLDHYRGASAFVFPSVWDEPFGMPIVEAMACGLPVVATRGGGIPEIVVDNETGLLVERGAPDALAESITTLLSNDNLRTAMGKRGRERTIATFSWDRVAGQLLDHYRMLHARTAPGRG